MDWQLLINIILTLTGLGFVLGWLLAFADLKFSLDIDPRVFEVEEILPKGQCGACGFGGCMAYAEAVVMDNSVSPALCLPGKDEVAKKVAEITGKKAEEVKAVKANILCRGKVDKSFIYEGIDDCNAAYLLFEGDRICRYSCLGYGSCVKACPFGAIVIDAEGSVVIDKNVCSGCGKCVSVCPKGVISLIPEKAKVAVFCSSQDKGGEVKKICSVGCIGCQICAKECPNQAITIENFLARVEYEKCFECNDLKCLPRCPSGSIIPIN